VALIQIAAMVMREVLRQSQGGIGKGDGFRDLWSRGGNQRRLRGTDKPPQDTSGWQYYALTDDAVKDANPAIHTSTNSDDIVRPCDIYHYLVRQIGGLAGGSMHTTSSTFGSFTQARIDLDAKLASGSWDIVYRILEPEDQNETAARLSSQCPIAFWRSQWDSKVRAQVYKSTPDTWDYFPNPDGDAHSWSWDTDILKDSLLIGTVPADQCYSEIHVKYDLHAPTGQYMKECWVGPAGSDDGTGTRDQNAAAPENRETIADYRRDNLGIKRTLTVECDQLYLDTTAVAFRNYLFDRSRPRVVVRFDTWARVIGLEPNMATLMSDDLLDNVGPPPVYPGMSTGSVQAWSDLKFFVAAPVTLRGTQNGMIGTVILEEIT
jgi:hypothetical protein